MIDREKQQIIGAGLKTKKRKRVPIVVATFVIPVLEDLCALTKDEMLLDRKRDAFYTEFHTVLSRYGIVDRTPYACRHTTATALALGNIGEEIIREVMRHTKVETTRKYIHKNVDTIPMLTAIDQLKHD